MPDTHPAAPRVEIFTGPHCGYCHRAKALLAHKSLTFRERDASSPDVRTEMLQRLPGARTVPQIFIDGRHVGGCDDLEALESCGELDALIAGAATR